MVKKNIRSKKQSRIHRKNSTHKSSLNSRGKTSTGVLGVLFLIIGVSAALGFGYTNLSPNGPGSAQASYSCCDSGDKENCHPLNKTITVDMKNRGPQQYDLLKSNILIREPGHLDFIPPGSKVSGLPAGETVLMNTVSEMYNNPNLILQGVPAPTYYGRACGDLAGKDSLEGAGHCEAIPDDEILWVCRTGCKQLSKNQAGEDIFDIYIRDSDYQTSGVPHTIAYCTKPDTATVPLKGSTQEVINLPSPTEQANLQLETFYVKQEPVMAHWLSPWCKPAIYLYPQTAENIHVGLNPALPLTYTDPVYPQGGWDVFAEPKGNITYQQKQYDYLYYETKVSTESYVLPKEGYVVAATDLPTFLPTLVTQLGLNQKETNAFVEYWEKALPKSSYYEVKVVEQKQLDSIDPLFITPKPNTVIRVTLHFKALDKTETLAAPVIQPVKRSGFTVVEWGGMFERDANHPFSCLQ